MKHLSRISPVSLSDPRGLEHWLQHMSARGLHLYHWSGALSFRFDRGEAAQLRYRLHPLQHGPAEPPADLVELYASFGWTYVTMISTLYCVFSSDDPAAQEPFTQPEELKIALGWVMKRRRWSLLGSAVYLVIFLSALLYSMLSGTLYSYLLDISPIYLSFLFAVPAMISVFCFLELRDLLHLSSSIRTGMFPPRGSGEAGYRRAIRVRTFFTSLVTVAAAAYLILDLILPSLSKKTTPLTEWEATIPLLTLSEIEGPAFRPAPFHLRDTGLDADYGVNCVMYQWSVTEPEQLWIDQSGEISGERATLTITYRRLLSPAYAQAEFDRLGRRYYDADELVWEEIIWPGVDRFLRSEQFDRDLLLLWAGDRAMAVEYHGDQDIGLFYGAIAAMVLPT